MEIFKEFRSKLEKPNTKKGTSFLVVGFGIVIIFLHLIETDNLFLKFGGAAFGIVISTIGSYYTWKDLNQTERRNRLLTIGLIILMAVVTVLVLLQFNF